MWQCERVVHLLNSAQNILQTFKFIKTEVVNICPYLMWFIFKTAIVNFAAQFSIIFGLNHILIQITGSGDYVSIVSLSVSYTVQTLLLNVFYTMLLVGSYLYNRLNGAIFQITKKAYETMSYPSDDSKYIKIQKYCNFADELDEIMIFHRKITVWILTLNKIWAIQLMAGMTNILVVCIVQV